MPKDSEGNDLHPEFIKLKEKMGLVSEERKQEVRSVLKQIRRQYGGTSDPNKDLKE